MPREAKICDCISDNFVKFAIVLQIAALSFILQACAASSFSDRAQKAKEEKKEPLLPYRYEKVEEPEQKENNVVDDYSEFSEEDDIGNEISNESKGAVAAEILLNKSAEDISSENFSFEEVNSLIESIKKYLNTPYKYGSKNERGMDCSGFALTVFNESLNIKLPRSARAQFQVGQKISKDNLTFGDLVFFDTSRKYKPGHVGIYLYDNFFVHSSSSLGVTISSLQEEYYKKRYYGARRIILSR